MYDKYKDKIHFLMINTRDDVVQGKLLIRELGYTFPIIYDEDEKIAKLYRIQPIPMNIFIDKDGVIQVKKLGAIDETDLEQYLQYLLEN